MTAPVSLTITMDDVRGWVQRRADLLSEVAAIDDRLRAVRVLMPSVVDLVDMEKAGGSTSDGLQVAALADRPLTDLVLWALRDEKGGRDARWLRAYLTEIPEIAPRITKLPTGVSNAAHRLTERGRLIKQDGLYYLPSTYERIKSGELAEERVGNSGTPTFNSVMLRVLREYGKPFAAADAIKLARADDEASPLIEANPNRVYSWLAREHFRNRLIKEGDLYQIPSERDGASTATASDAPTAGEAATSPNKNLGGFNDLLG